LFAEGSEERAFGSKSFTRESFLTTPALAIWNYTIATEEALLVESSRQPRSM